ncbi:MAG: glucose 1-dehydrogenase [Caulobacteraceae bacterium]|nr:glucose 1-dehydrogenase [Caulobacteraceae bacterium]
MTTPNPGRVAGKKVFITGGAQGLGAAMARRLAEEGAQLALADINLAGAKAVADEIDAARGAGTAFAFPLDVTKEEQWIFALEEADAALGGLSVLVNNAGVFRVGDIEKLALDDWKSMMSVNVDSVFLGTKHALKYLRENQPGSIVNISSIAGLIAGHNTPAYNASKAAVWMLSKSIALHCAHQQLDVRCNSIHPAFVDTPLLDPLRARIGKDETDAKLGRQVPLGRIGAPGDVADAVVYLASDESRFMTGAELKLDGGISAM